MKSGSLCLIFMVGLLVGCAGRPVRPPAVYQLQQMRHWYDQSRWRFEGRLAVAAEHDSFSGSIDWRHEPGSDAIEMAGPLGQGRVLLMVADGQVTIDDGEQVRFFRDQAETLIREQLGVAVPLHALRFWLLGLVEPGVDYRQTELGFMQHGWQVTYRELQPINGDWLPRKLAIENSGNKLKLIIDRWELM